MASEHRFITRDTEIFLQGHIDEDGEYVAKKTKAVYLEGYEGPGGDVVIPEGVTEINEFSHVFDKVSLNKLTIPKSYTASEIPFITAAEGPVEFQVAEGNALYKSIDGIIYDISGKKLLRCPVGKSGEVSIPSTVNEINEFAFNKCINIEGFQVNPMNQEFMSEQGVLYSRNMKEIKQYPGKIRGKVYISEEVNISSDAFSNCLDITDIEVHPDNPWLMSYNGLVYSKDGTELLVCPKGKEGEVVLYEGLINADESIFNGCQQITKIVFPEKFEKFDTECSWNSPRPFVDCDNLRELVIPAKVFSVSVISKALGLEHVEIVPKDEQVYSIDGVPYYYSARDKKVRLEVLPRGYKGQYVVPKDVEEICEHAFSNCSELEELAFEGVVPKISTNTSLGYFTVFLGCNKLKISSNVFRTIGKIPVPFSACIGNMSDEDLQWTYLGQSAKGWKTALEQAVKEKNKSLFLNKMVDILSDIKKLSKDNENNLVEFVVTYRDELKQQDIFHLMNLLEAKKCSAAIKKIKEDKRLEELLNGKEETVNHPAEAIVKDNWVQSGVADELLTLLDKGIPYVDSELVCSTKVLAFVIATYANQMDDAPKCYSAYEKSFVRTSFISVADQVAECLDQEALQQVIEKISYDGKNMEKGYVLALGRYGSPTQISEMISKMKEWSKWGKYAATGRKYIIIARGALMLNDSKEAMLAVDEAKALDYYANLRNTTGDILRDTVLSEFGLDDNMQKVYDLGNEKRIMAKINKDFTISLCDLGTGKIVKSLPKRGADELAYEGANSDFSDMKKNIKKIVKARNEKLFQKFLDGTEIVAKDWRKSYTENPLLRQVAGLLVWEQTGVTFTIKENEAIDCQERKVNITEDPIRVAHPMEMKLEEVELWQNYFVSQGLKQMFPQIWEPIRDKKNIKKNRYAGCVIPCYRFMKREKHGMEVTGLYDVDLWFEDCNVKFKKIDGAHSMLEPSHTFEITEIKFSKYTRYVNHHIAYLDRITAYDKIMKDDVSVKEVLPEFTASQIQDFIDVANENNAVNVLAMLLEYKNEKFVDYNWMGAFTLEV